MSAEHVEARRGAYADSVTLMRVSAEAQAVAGVRTALVAMGTELNLQLLEALGMRRPAGVGQHDLLVAIRAQDAASLGVAVAVVNDALAAPARSADQAAGLATARPMTTSSAIARSGPGIALVSVPGPYALAEACAASRT